MAFATTRPTPTLPTYFEYIQVAAAIESLSKDASVDCYLDNVIQGAALEEANRTSTPASSDAAATAGGRRLRSLQAAAAPLDLSACPPAQTTLEAAITVRVDSPEAYSVVLTQLTPTLSNQTLVDRNGVTGAVCACPVLQYTGSAADSAVAAAVNGLRFDAPWPFPPPPPSPAIPIIASSSAGMSNTLSSPVGFAVLGGMAVAAVAGAVWVARRTWCRALPAIPISELIPPSSRTRVQPRSAGTAGDATGDHRSGACVGWRGTAEEHSSCTSVALDSATKPRNGHQAIESWTWSAGRALSGVHLDSATYSASARSTRHAELELTNVTPPGSPRPSSTVAERG